MSTAHTMSLIVDDCGRIGTHIWTYAVVGNAWSDPLDARKIDVKAHSWKSISLALKIVAIHFEPFLK